MFDEPVVFVDIETTGGSYRSSRIIELAALRMENNKIVDELRLMIHPGSPIPYHITSITGIRDADVAHAPRFEQVAQQIYDFLDGALFVAHNVRFDYSFIKRELELCSIRYNPRMLCSVRMSRALYPEVKGHSLQAIINRFDIPVQNRHRAYDDADAIRKFFEVAVTQKGPRAFANAVKNQLKHKTAPPNVDSAAFATIPNTPGVYTFLDADQLPIYIGKSITLRKRIMSHFAQATAIDKEMKLSLHTHKISFVETASELEALLLESKMVKENLPLYNRQLRKLKKMYILKVVSDVNEYKTVVIDYIDADNLEPSSTIYGVYPSKMKARRALETIQKTYDVCPVMLGLEKSKTGCFKLQLKKCYGACIGIDLIDAHNSRLEIAFSDKKMDDWPFKNPVVLAHSNNSKHLVLDKWNIVGELQSEDNCDPHYTLLNNPFDLDTYKIIRSYLSHKSAQFKLSPITYTQLELYA